LLASADVNVFCRCVSGKGIAVECGNAIRIACCFVFWKYGFLKRWGEGASIWVGEEKRV
jgi:hypothetical protein